MDSQIRRIIREINTSNSNDINKAISFLVKNIKKSPEINNKIKEYNLKIQKMKEQKKEDEEKKFLDYLHKIYILQEEEKRKESELKKIKEEVFQEKMKLYNKLSGINWNHIKYVLNDYILLSLNQLLENNYNITKSSNNDVYTFYTELRDGINEQFTELYKFGINYFFTSQYEFKPSAELFKLEELQGIISKFEELKRRNSDISIDIAKQLLETTEKSNKESNLILAIKIAHSIYKDYIDELEENFKTLRQEFKGSVSDKLIYVALYSSNNYIDSAREFLEAKKNTSGSWANNNNNNYSHQPTLPIPNNSDNQQQNTNNSDNQQQNTTFSQGIQQLTSHKFQSEFRLLEEYDEEEKSLHESQRNHILYNNEKYDSSEFIRDSLNDNEFYEALNDLLFSESNDQYISFKIGNFDIAKKYREKIKCNINQLKEKIIRYKIFESFCGKQFSRVIFSNNNIEFRQIYESNRELHDIFIQLILFFNNDHELSQIDLSLFLKIIACVIVFYYAKKRNGITTIETILSQELSGPELKKAQDYIIYLRTLLNTNQNLSDEEYFKLFGRIRTKISNKNSQKDRDKEAKAQAARDEAALRIQEKLEQQAKGSRSRQIIVNQQPQPNTKSNTISTQAFVNKKKTATDEDKSQIIMKAFENMKDRESILMPLLGFNETISFGKESDNFENVEDITKMNTIAQLKIIYEKYNTIIDHFFKLLNQLSQLIKINDKKEGDYKNILNKVTNLIDILRQMSGIFITSISNTSLRPDINILLSSIIDNLTKNIGAKYDDEYQLKFPKKREELTENQIKEYLLLLEILDDKSFNGQSPENKRKYIDKQYRLAMKKHSNKKKQTGINNENNTEFKIIQDAKNKLILFYEPVNEPVNNPNNQTNYNTNNFSEFKRKFLEKNQSLMPHVSSEQNDIEILKLIKKAYKESKESNLLDIIIKKINIENLSILKLDSLNSLKSLFQLFSPFNILYNTRFTEINNISGNFILLVKNDIVIRFNVGISSRDYLELCSNIDKYIKYILNDKPFINGTVDNEEIFKQSVYYNFFLNLRSIIDIILKYLTDKNPRYEILFKIKKALDDIIQNIHKLDTDKKLYIFKTKKNQSDVLFVPNKFNVRKTGQKQKRELKGKIMKEIDELFKSSKNSLNKLYNSKTNQTEEEKKIILLDELKKLIRKLLRKYNISFEDFVKGKDNDIKEIIESFFKKLNSDLGEKYSQSYVDDLITQLIASETKSKFLKEKILDPVIINLVNKLLSFKAKRLKGIILELLYIIVISFTSKRQLSQNIKRQKEEIQIVNNSSQALLSKINKENKEKKMALIVVERLNNKAKQLNSLGPSITNEQKQNALDKELKKATRELKVTKQSLALIVLGNRSTTLSTNVGKEFFNKLKTSLLLLEGPTQPPKKNMNNPVVPKPVVPKPVNTSILTYNSLNSETKSSVVKELQAALKDKHKAPRIAEIAAGINQNRPIGITNKKSFKQEIIKRVRNPFKIPHNDTELIQEFSSKYVKKQQSDGEKLDVLQKILRVIQQIKANKSLGITSIAQYKKEIQKRLNKNSTDKNKLNKEELTRNKREIKTIIQNRINKFKKNTHKGISKITNEEIETSIDDYLQNSEIKNKSFDNFIDYLFTKKTNVMEVVN